MAEEKNLTVEEAQKWVDGREWANGWNAQADRTVNALEFAKQYEKNKPLWDKLFTFLAETDPMTLQPGKIVLEEGKLWVNVMEYTPKAADDTRIESHNDFIDLQYTFVGDELYGLAEIENVTPTTEYDPVKDRTFFKANGPVEYSPADAGVFFLYFPGELHQPSVRTDKNQGMSKKLVGKIAYVK